MQQKTKNLIEELDKYLPQHDKHQILESRAANIIASANHLVQLINESFNVNESEELTKRLLLAIKNNDPEKLNRKIREYKIIGERGNRNEQCRTDKKKS